MEEKSLMDKPSAVHTLTDEHSLSFPPGPRLCRHPSSPVIKCLINVSRCEIFF